MQCDQELGIQGSVDDAEPRRYGGQPIPQRLLTVHAPLIRRRGRHGDQCRVTQPPFTRELGRNCSTISRELARKGARLDRDEGNRVPDDANQAHKRAGSLAHALGPRKLDSETVLFSVMRDDMKAGWSPGPAEKETLDELKEGADIL